MKFLRKEKVLSFFAIVFLFQMELSNGYDASEEALEELQKHICYTHTSNSYGEDICLRDKVNIERVVFCYLYTSSIVSEALCLKNKTLSYEDIAMCFIGTDTLIEQVCLLGEEVNSKITDQNDSPNIEFLKIIENEISNVIRKRVKLDIFEGGFVIDTPIIDESNINQPTIDELMDESI